MEIQYINFEVLNDTEKAALEVVLADGLKKFERLLKNPSKLVVQVKLKDTTGKRKRYNINMRAEAPNATFSSETMDWDLNRTARKAVNDIEKEILHRYRQDTSYKKSYE
ncbi:hypothetical protein ACFLZX_04295 [Nanoarchaeota archaeon]